MKAFLFCTVCCFMGSACFASSRCEELKEELKVMQQAQAQILHSLVSNHELMAQTQEEYSDLLLSVRRSKVLSEISRNMNQSAKLIRKRGVQAEKMAVKLNLATAELISEITHCLK